MTKALLLSLLMVTLLTGMGIGYFLTPEYATMKSEEGMSDKDYLNGMIAHHLSAIHMSKQAIKNSSRPEVRGLSEAIIAADERDIQELYDLKKTLFSDERQVTKYDQINLGKPDVKFDQRFLNAMLEHHRQAIEMAREVRQLSTNTEILNIADQVIVALESNSRTLLDWQTSWYQI